MLASSRCGFSLLLLFTLLMGAATGVHAVNCSDPPYNGLIDGNVFPASPAGIKIDVDCTVQNFPASNPLDSNFTFDNSVPLLAIFDNVIHTGQMSCNVPAGHKIWFTNGSVTDIPANCQNFVVPAEAIDKQSPVSAGIGDPFTYTLTLPVYLGAGSSDNELSNVIITDDLNAAGADLSLVGTPVVSLAGTPLIEGVDYTFINAGGLLTFNIPLILIGDQIVIEITAVLNNTGANVVGATFTNTAKWQFDREIDVNEDGFIDPLTEIFTLPGEWGVVTTTIAEPNLVVTKTNPDTALNFAVPSTFTIDVQNTGGSAAWNITVLDQLPGSVGNDGMCFIDPSASATAQIFAADGSTPVTGVLTQASPFFSVTYTAAPTCQLSFGLLSPAMLGPNQHLIITYQTELDPNVVDASLQINVAGATEWFTGDPGGVYPVSTYTRTLSDGTPLKLDDHEDNKIITAALSGYFFQKMAVNVTTGENPARTAAPGDTLAYRLRFFNLNLPVNKMIISDQLDLSSFDISTFKVTTLPTGGGTITTDPVTNAGLLEIGGLFGGDLNIAADGEILMEFEIDLLPNLTTGAVVSNQANLSAEDPYYAGPAPIPFINADSDDPFDLAGNGISAPGDPNPDSTDVVIITPGPLSKVNPASVTATIGEQFTYTITVPETVVSSPMYDVRILDDLTISNADLSFVSAAVVSGGTWTLSNTGTATYPVIEDLVTGIDIPAGGQAVIEVTVELLNTATNVNGLSFNNTATYTYNRSNGATQTDGVAGVTSDMTVVESSLSAIKTVTNATPLKLPTDPLVDGDILEYTLTVTNDGTATAYDVNIVDTLPAELAFDGTFAPTATINTVSVIGFVATPSGAPAGPLLWGLDNADANLDIPVGGVLVLTYRTQLTVGVSSTFSNEVWVDWSSLQGSSGSERTGVGCPLVVASNDYCFGPASVTSTIDNNSLTKAVIADSWITDGSTVNDATVRIGDIVTYQLTLSLGEGTTNSVTVSDVLPAGMAFGSLVSITPASGVDSFAYALAAQPVAGNTGTLVWNFGDVVNTPSGDGTPTDALVIEYTTTVLPDAGIVQVPPTTILTNTATLGYVDGGTPIVDPVRLESSSSITVLQPILAVTKMAVPAGVDSIVDSNELITYTVNIINSGTAPAYDTVLQDVIPVGLRNGFAPITMVSTTLLNTPTSLINFAPVYDPATGIATWNFDSGAADQYSIPAGDTLQIVYEVQADAALSASMTLTNQAQVQLFYSFDNNAVPTLAGINGVSQVYGPTNISTVTLTTAGPNPLSKQNPATLTVAVGDIFTYRITVPEIPMTTALNDVRILDDLTASAADLGFISVTRISGSQTWTPVNSGAVVNNLIIEDLTNGIDIPAGEQVEIDITVVVNDSPTNVSGLLFNNTASYTYNQLNGDVATQLPGGGDVTADMTIIGADLLTMEKSGPAQMNPAVAGVFTLNVHNTGTATAWDLTVTDILPNPVPGGMCDTPPANITAQIFLANGTTAVPPVLIEGFDYTTAYVGCTLTITMNSVAAALPADNRLIVSYEAMLDVDNPQGAILTNVAGATEWFSGDTAGAGASGQIHTYSEILSNGTVGAGPLDHEDAHSIIAQSPIIQFQKTVVNVTTAENPGTTATPGDVLRYSILITNVGAVALTDFAITDEVDRLNAAGMFAAGSLTNISTPIGADVTNTDPNGGVNGTGLLDVRSLNLGVGSVLLIEFDVSLASVITSGTVVLNQAQLTTIFTGTLVTDDPNTNGVDDPAVLGGEDPTPITIISAPAFETWKISQDLTGDTAVLESGDTLRYTMTVKNTGTEDAINTVLMDQIPSNTTYLANSTSLNGAVIADPAAGVSALQSGMLINSADNIIPGYLAADIDPAANNVATVSFDVIVSVNALNGTVISNQGFVNGDGQGSGPFIEQITDDPSTVTLSDPTIDVVGSLPLVDSIKTVALQVDNGTLGIVDPGDTLRYTITVSNVGASAATGVVLSDATPVDTDYVANSVQLNGNPIGQPDGGVSPLITGIDISTSDLALPAAGAGTLTPGQLAVVTFDVQVKVAAAIGTIISNQGVVSSNEQADEPTDADGIDSNGDQVTQIIIGNAQLLSITKEVLVVGGGAALAGGQLEYIIRVTNISSVPANSVVITDNLDDPVAGQMSLVAGSATLNGSAVGVNYAAPIITADYAVDLLQGEIATLRFLVDLDVALTMGITVTNNAQVDWNAPVQSATASVSIDIGAIPGVASLNGTAWYDDNFNALLDAPEQLLAGWFVDIYRNGALLGSVVTDVNGVYQANGLTPNDVNGDQYELRFRAPGAGANTALLGMGDSIFTNNLQRVSDIVVGSGSNTQNLNLLLNPNGVVYDSILRGPIAGSTLTMLQAATGTPLPSNCFDDAAQQGQLTGTAGYYRFDINFSDPACTSGSDYLINIVAPATGYTAAPSIAITPVTDASTGAYSVPVCSADAVALTTHCEAQTSSAAPGSSIAPGVATNYYMHVTLANGTIPQDSQMFNNHIPIDPDLSNVVMVSKTSSLVNAKRGQLVPYTITANNTLLVALPNINIVDTIPAGFRYVAGSARLDGVDAEPVFDGVTLTWPPITLQPGVRYVIQLILVVGSGVSEGDYINRVQMIESFTNTPASPIATATVRVVPDPTFDCTDIIGKVFDDSNMNSYQDEAEKGIPNARIVSARGLIMKTDPHGRFHITCAAVPNQDRGSNFILKLDERSLPSGYRVVTENPRVQRATRGKMMKFNFGAAIHRVIRLDIADPVFEKGLTDIRLQWKPRLDLLLDELSKGASILRISYLADIEEPGLVDDRVDMIEEKIMNLIEQRDCCSVMTIETEIFWRRGGPPTRGSID